MRFQIAALCSVVAITLSACGGGSAGGTSPITGVLPGPAYALEPTDLIITGEGFSPLGGSATVRFEAEGGTPFNDGTSSMVEMQADIQGVKFVRGVLAPTHVESETNAFVVVVLSDGTEIRSSTPLAKFLPQELTGAVTPTLDGSAPAPFVLDGVNLRPSGKVLVSFKASGNAFHVGDRPVSELKVEATVTPGGERIEGTAPYAGVLTDTPCVVEVTFLSGVKVNSGTPLVTFTPGSVYVQGTYFYERVDSTSTGLDYSTITQHPIRGALIQLVDASSNQILTTRTLTDTGRFMINYSDTRLVRLRVLAETGPGEPPIRVEDNTNLDAIWAVESPPFSVPGATVDQDYVAGLGWDGAAYTQPRASAPFAILDTIYGAMRTFYDVRSPQLAPCIVNWSPMNRPEPGDKSLGQIGGAHYLDELYLSGKEDVDTDEFDTHLVVHEWGHYLHDKATRSDHIGGPHSTGDTLDPRVSFGEGLATGIAGVVLAPDTLYSDTYGPQQQISFWWDFEDNSIDFNAGWWSESSVESIITDLFDSQNDAPYDNVSLGAGVFWDTLTAMDDVDSLQTIFTFITLLKQSQPAIATDIDTLCGFHQIDPVQDEWGTGETHNVFGVALPVYESMIVDGSASVRYVDGFEDYNDLSNNRFARFTGTGGTITVSVTTPTPSMYIDDHDIAVRVLKRGQQVDYADEYYYGAETCTFSTVAGEPYVIVIENLGYAPFFYPCTIEVVTP